MMRRTATIALVLILVLAAGPGCTFLKFKKAPSSSAITATDPLTGKWEMTRVSIEPSLPAEIPELVINQIFPKKSTWTIGSSGGQLNINYDGKAIWFNSLGIDVVPRAVSPAVTADKRSCTFSSGGDINEKSLSGVLSVIASATGSPQNIAIGYSDQVKVTLISEDQISATITYNATGTYTSDHGAGTLNNSATLTYTGSRK